jgi:uncharacterized protein with HEPN domain
VKASRRAARDRLTDVTEAIAAINRHRARGDLDDPLVFDAVRMRLVEIGEAVGTLPAELLDTEPEVPWREVVAMRHTLAHHDYDTAIGILATTIDEDLGDLGAAIDRLMRRIEGRG